MINFGDSAAIGRIDPIPRRELKVFVCVRFFPVLERHFDAFAVKSIALRGWFLFLSFTLWIVARTRNFGSCVDQCRM